MSHVLRVLNECKKTLYIQRKLLNADDLIAWAKANGFKDIESPNEMHVTVAFSRRHIDWDTVGNSCDTVAIPPGQDQRSVQELGAEGAVVLRFESTQLQQRWKQIYNDGASWDYPSYKPHVTITYNGRGLDLSKILPYRGPLVFGPEEFAEIK
jgi:hypothetical protein